MNIESMPVRSYRSIAADEHLPEEAAERYRTLKACENLRAAGCSEEGALGQLGISRRTRYRWQSPMAPMEGLGFILHLIGTLRDKLARRKSFRELPALLLDGRLATGRLVETLVLVVVAVSSKQAMVAPFLDGVGRDVEHGSSFADAQQAAARRRSYREDKRYSLRMACTRCRRKRTPWPVRSPLSFGKVAISASV